MRMEVGMNVGEGWRKNDGLGENGGDYIIEAQERQFMW